MTYPDDDDEIEFADYETMDQRFFHDPSRRFGLHYGMEQHPLWPRIQREGWTSQFDPDVYLYKKQRGAEFGIWPEFQFDFQPGARGWRVAVNGEGIFWKKFDTLGDALDSIRDRNFRGYERLLPDPSNDVDSDYEQVLYGFAVANGTTPGASSSTPPNYNPDDENIGWE